MRPRFSGWSAVIAAVLAMASAAPQQAPPSIDTAPSRFSVSDFRLTWSESVVGPGHRKERLVISGNGSCSYWSLISGSEKSSEFALDRGEVEQALIALFENRFFELNDAYAVRPGLDFHPNGVAQRTGMSRSHDPDTTITVEIGPFR